MNDAVVPQLVWVWHSGLDGYTLHDVVKVTAKRLYVRGLMRSHIHTFGGCHDPRTFVVDRAELERDGEVWLRTQRCYVRLEVDFKDTLAWHRHLAEQQERYRCASLDVEERLLHAELGHDRHGMPLDDLLAWRTTNRDRLRAGVHSAHPDLSRDDWWKL